MQQSQSTGHTRQSIPRSTSISIIRFVLHSVARLRIALWNNLIDFLFISIRKVAKILNDFECNFQGSVLLLFRASPECISLRLFNACCTLFYVDLEHGCCPCRVGFYSIMLRCTVLYTSTATRIRACNFIVDAILYQNQNKRMQFWSTSN